MPPQGPPPSSEVQIPQVEEVEMEVEPPVTPVTPPGRLRRKRRVPPEYHRSRKRRPSEYYMPPGSMGSRDVREMHDSLDALRNYSVKIKTKNIALKAENLQMQSLLRQFQADRERSSQYIKKMSVSQGMQGIRMN